MTTRTTHDDEVLHCSTCGLEAGSDDSRSSCHAAEICYGATPCEFSRATVRARIVVGTTVHAIGDGAAHHPGTPGEEEIGKIGYDSVDLDFNDNDCAYCGTSYHEGDDGIYVNGENVGNVDVKLFWHEDMTMDGTSPFFTLCRDCGLALGIRIVPCDCYDPLHGWAYRIPSRPNTSTRTRRQQK